MIINLYENNSNIIAFKQNNIKKNNKIVAPKNIDTVSFRQSKENKTSEKSPWLAIGISAAALTTLGLAIFLCNKKHKTSVLKPCESSKKEPTLEIDKNGFSLLPLSKVRTYKKPELELMQMVKNGGTSHIKFSQEVKTLNSALKMEQPLLFEDNPNWELVKKMPETFSNFEINEVMTIIPYSIGKFHNDRITPIKQQRYYSEHNSRLFKKYKECKQHKKIEYEKDALIEKIDEQAIANRKQFFASYIKERSKYIDNNNQLDILRQNLLKDKNPSEDVVDAELLRMDIVTNQAGAFLTSKDCFEQNLYYQYIETPLAFLFNSYFSAKMLSEFKPQKKDLDENEKKYLEEINKFGTSESEKIKQQIKQQIKSYYDDVTNPQKAEKKYTKEYKPLKNQRNLFFLNYWQNSPISSYEPHCKSPEKIVNNNFYSKITLLDIVSDKLQQEYKDKFYTDKDKVIINEKDMGKHENKEYKGYKKPKKDSIKNTLCRDISDLYELICELIEHKKEKQNIENKAENRKYEYLQEKIKEKEQYIEKQKKDIQNKLEYLLDDADICKSSNIY